MSARIGIPLCLDANERIRPGRRYQYLDTRYAEAVSEAGGSAFYLPLQADGSGLLAAMDGLLLPGGDDFPPPRAYPDSVHFDSVSESQLSFDRQLLARAIERNMPVLAICYGMQLVALHSGGRLHYHIPSDVPAAVEHQLDEKTGRHRLLLEPNTQLAALLETETCQVNSLHHQGVAAVGDGWRVSARAEDGTIEAIEARSSKFCLGVQWHPERLGPEHRSRLFGAFVSACRDYRSKHRDSAR